MVGKNPNGLYYKHMCIIIHVSICKVDYMLAHTFMYVVELQQGHAHHTLII